ncbi:MAG: hypothetical protein H0W45_02945 [Acidobacteria bacterium]|nr:hypothetical protein [Acidobacteriota bacterium]
MKNTLKDLFMKNNLTPLLSLFVLFGMLSLAQNSASAQGRGRGNASGAGNPGVNRPTNPNVDFGLGNASRRSNGRSDRSLETAETRSNGRSGAGLERARLGRENARRAESDVRNNPQAARLLGTNANNLLEKYQSALANNPDLKFGQFVAANMLARNLGSRYPQVTPTAILEGLGNGDSIARTLKNFGLSSRQARDAERRAKQMIEDDKEDF